MGRPQVRHLPRSQSQPKIGTLSYQFMSVWHRGHREAGATMETSSGIRKMQTFRKLPITMPKRKMKAMTKVCAAQSLHMQCATHAPPPSTQALAPSVRLPNTYGCSVMAPSPVIAFPRHKPRGLTFAILPGCRFTHSLAPRLLGVGIFMNLDRSGATAACSTTYLLLSQRKGGMLPVGNQNGGAREQTLS